MKSTKLPSWIDRLLGVAPVAAPPYGFACGPDRIVYSGFGRDGKGSLALRQWQVEELAPDTFQPGLLGGPAREPQTLAGHISDLIDRVSPAPKEASLVLPDAWLRVAFTELDELPGDQKTQDEVLRWKLKRLVPFRVDDLRVRATEVAPLPGQSEAKRVMLGFAIEALLAQLESSFAEAGVRIGSITNASLAVHASVAKRLDPSALSAIARVTERGYTLMFARGSEPILHRYKAFADGLPADALGDFVRRDLLLTANFINEQLPNDVLAGILLLAPQEGVDIWYRWLGDGLGAPVEVLGDEHLPPMVGPVPAWSQLAPLVGAISQEVA